jgi:hypothetical protein
MSQVIRRTCSHCLHDSYYDGSPDGLSDAEVLALTAMRCAQCGEEGAVVTLNLERPPESVVARGIPGSVFREPAHFGNLTTR